MDTDATVRSQMWRRCAVPSHGVLVVARRVAAPRPSMTRQAAVWVVQARLPASAMTMSNRSPLSSLGCRDLATRYSLTSTYAIRGLTRCVGPDEHS